MSTITVSFAITLSCCIALAIALAYLEPNQLDRKVSRHRSFITPPPGAPKTGVQSNRVPSASCRVNEGCASQFPYNHRRF